MVADRHRPPTVVVDILLPNGTHASVALLTSGFSAQVNEAHIDI
jgi:hypothetical protein